MKNAAEKAAYDARYRETHREQIAAKNRAYRASHREHDAAYKAAWMLAGGKERRAKAEAQVAAYRTTHKAEIRAKDAIYKANHREQTKARSAARYRARRGPGLTCAYEPCGKIFWRPIPQSRPPRYCSRACMGSSYHDNPSPKLQSRQSDRPSSDGKTSGRGGRPHRHFRRAVFDRDGRICRMCGSDKNLEINHILPWKGHPELRFEPTNGEVLCHDCHRYEVHGHVRGGKPDKRRARQPNSISSLALISSAIGNLQSTERSSAPLTLSGE